jgi:hypothetical protein
LVSASSLLSFVSYEKQGIVPDLLIGTDLFELKGICSDSTHTNGNGAAVTGVEKREINIPLEIQKQASDS